jgi:hypothetical protein
MSKYQTPVGGFDTWEEAAQAVERCDMDPCDTIKFVDVCWEHQDGQDPVRLSFSIRVF